MPMVKVMVSMTKEMKAALEKECKDRKILTVPEVIRQIISEYLRTKQ